MLLVLSWSIREIIYAVFIYIIYTLLLFERNRDQDDEQQHTRIISRRLEEKSTRFFIKKLSFQEKVHDIWDTVRIIIFHAFDVGIAPFAGRDATC